MSLSKPTYMGHGDIKYDVTDSIGNNYNIMYWSKLKKWVAYNDVNGEAPFRIEYSGVSAEFLNERIEYKRVHKIYDAL